MADIIQFPGKGNQSKPTDTTLENESTGSKVVSFPGPKTGKGPVSAPALNVYGVHLVSGHSILGSYLDHFPRENSLLNQRLGVGGYLVLKNCLVLTASGGTDTDRVAMSMYQYLPFSNNDFNIFSDQHIISMFVPVPELAEMYEQIVTSTPSD